MTQPNLQEQYDPKAVDDCWRQAHEFLGKAREWLALGRLHKASRNGWAAAVWMVKAVTIAKDWEFKHRDQFNLVLASASELTGNYRIHDLGACARGLGDNYYVRKRFLIADDVAWHIDRTAELMDLLEPLTVPNDGQTP